MNRGEAAGTVVALAALGVAACGRERGLGPGDPHVAARDAGGGAVHEADALPRAVFFDRAGRLSSARADGATLQPLDVGVPSAFGLASVEGGRALLVSTPRRELLRVDVGAGKAATRLDADVRHDAFLAASDDGRWAVVRRLDAEPPGAPTPIDAVRLGSERRVPLGEVRALGGVDLSGDGRLVVFAGASSSCSTRLESCPVAIHRVDLEGDRAEARALVSDAFAHDQPRLLVDRRARAAPTGVVFRTTANDRSPACTAKREACRHDLVRLDFASKTRTVIHERALGPCVSPDGARLAFLVDQGTAYAPYLRAEPTIALVVTDAAGADPRVLVQGGLFATYANGWSPDGRWLAFSVWSNDELLTEICDVDRSACHLVGTDDLTFVGWLR